MRDVLESKDVLEHELRSDPLALLHLGCVPLDERIERLGLEVRRRGDHHGIT